MDTNAKAAFFMDGDIIFINEERKPTEKFTVKDFGIDASIDVNGQQLTNQASFQTSGTRIAILDGLGIGDRIRVHFAVSGRASQKQGLEPTPNNPNGTQCFTNLNAYKIEMIEKATNHPAPVVDEEDVF